jgi:hypothetical protein
LAKSRQNRRGIVAGSSIDHRMTRQHIEDVTKAPPDIRSVD